MCKKFRSKCDCEFGWVGDFCDWLFCKVLCKFGLCLNDLMKCECFENYFGLVCER